MDQYRSELLEFMATPGITKKDREEIDVEGAKAYTNQTLKYKLKADIKKYLPRYSSAIFEKMIDSNELIPVFTTKSLWDRFIKKRKEIDLSTVGVYSWVDDKIYIFMDSVLSYTKLKVFTGTQDGSLLRTTIFHEAMHMAKNRNPIKFYEFNKIPLLKFNSYLLFKHFDIKDAEKKKKAMGNINSFNKYIITYPKRKLMDMQMINNFIGYITDFSSLNNEDLHSRYDEYYNSIYYYDRSQQGYEHGQKEIQKIMQEAYKKLFKFSVDLKWINEEIIIYDGIIAKLAEHNPNLPYVKKSLRLTV